MSVNTLTQKQIIDRYSVELSTSCVELVETWDAGMGELAHTRQARWGWLSGKTKIGPTTLRTAKKLYSSDSWQHRLAVDLLAVYRSDRGKYKRAGLVETEIDR
jgi:hypothetical protein